MVKEIEEIIDAGIEPRLAALIYRAGYRREDLATLTQEDIMKIRGVGKKKAEDILSVIKEGVNTQNEKSTDLEYEGLMASNKLKEYFYEYVAGNDCDLYTLKPLSIYSINTFLDNDFRTFNDVVKLTEIQIAEFDSKHRTINEELEKARAYYFSAHKNNIIKFINNLDGNVINEEKTPTSAKELLNWIAVNGYQDEFKEYLEYTDIDILALGLSNRLINSLKTNGLFNLSDLIQINPEKVANFKQLGKAGYREYLECRESFLNRNINEITNFCKGTDKRIKYDYYQTRILDSLSKKTNACQFDDIAEEFPELNEEELQDCLDSLKKKKRIRINRNGISYALPSFVDIVYRLPEGNRQTILVQRLSGKTLEEVGKSFGLTRERIRQLENKGIADAVNLNLKLNHTDRFKENEYVEIYERYNMLGEDFRECFGLSIVEYYAVVLLSRKKGSKAFDESILDDETISKQLKAKIQKFLDKDVIKIKGERIPIRKAEIRTYVIERYCKKEVTIEDFVKLHNDFLDSHKLGERKDLLIDEEQSRTMENQISLRNDVLWKQGAKFRHYDIYARDYTELFADLDLPSYENIQISTEKLIKENKKLVKKYDIHDEYELHNLIKKIYSTPELFEQYKVYFGEDKANSITFKRMPTLVFGTFDRDRTVKKLLMELAPIKVKDFVSFLSKEFGYDEIVINANWVTHLAKYVKRKGIYGEYDIDAKQMSQENKEKLESAITEPFYTFDDLRNIYADICPEADPEEINAMNLKAMGYTVNDEYIVTGGFNSMKEYLDYLIENNTNLTDIRKKTGKVRLDTYLYEKQSCYDIIMYSANDYITISKLEAIGINKTDIYRFYQEIVALVDDDEYFNYKTIKEKYSYSSILDNLGFDDYFYNRILVFCGRFTWTGAFGTMVFRKNKSEDITKASFVNYFAKKYAPIELADFIHMIESTYGTDTITRDRLVYLFDNEVYYNKVLDMIFENYASFSSYIENY